MKKDKIIIIFSGKQFSGKDTVAGILLRKLSTFKRIGIADSIKELYSKQSGLSISEIENNKHKYRQDLIDLGNWGRAQSPDFWLKKIAEYDGNTIVTDVRMKYELDFFRKLGAYTVRVEASVDVRSKRGTISALNDNTETELDNIKDWDYIIDNNSDYEELENNCDKLINTLKSKYKELL